MAEQGPDSPLKWCRQALDHRSPETEMACRTLINRLDQSTLLTQNMHIFAATNPIYGIFFIRKMKFQLISCSPFDSYSYLQLTSPRHLHESVCLSSAAKPEWCHSVWMIHFCAWIESLHLIQQTTFIIYHMLSVGFLQAAGPKQQSHSHHSRTTACSHGLDWITFPLFPGLLSF